MSASRAPRKKLRRTRTEQPLGGTSYTCAGFLAELSPHANVRNRRSTATSRIRDRCREGKPGSAGRSVAVGGPGGRGTGGLPRALRLRGRLEGRGLLRRLDGRGVRLRGLLGGRGGIPRLPPAPQRRHDQG